MKVYGPDFFKDFHCIGSSCLDNCCRMGWDIEIDDDTYSYYSSIGNGICSHISSDGNEHYIMQENGQCPFLNEKGLCSLLLGYGEEHISQICAQHPRFYQWFGGCMEAGTGLCCEESARLWLEHAGKISFCEWETDEEDDDLAFDAQMLEAVRNAREVLFDLMQCDELTFSQKMKALLIFGLNAQDMGAEDDPECYNELAQVFSDTEKVKELVGQLGESTQEEMTVACFDVLSCFEELDYMKGVFPGAISRIKSRLDSITANAGAFDKACPEVSKQLCAVGVYNIFRYFIECASGAQCLPIMVSSILNMWFIRMWDILMWLEDRESFGITAQINAVKEYSKEVEYSDNTDALWECAYTDSRLSADRLAKIAEV